MSSGAARAWPDDAMEMLQRRIVTMAGVAWVSLLLLSILHGQAWADSVTVLFLRDVELHVRLLIALPLLAVADIEDPLADRVRCRLPAAIN